MKRVWPYLVVLALALGAFFILEQPPTQAGTPRRGSIIVVEEHPWDLLKRAYKYEILLETVEYVFLAVWFDEEQIDPIIIRVSRSAFYGPSCSRRKLKSGTSGVLLD